MERRIGLVTLLVRDYDEAIAFFTTKLSFSLLQDTPVGGGKRWVVVAPPEAHAAGFLLARADGPAQNSRVGNQTGGRVAFFLCTDDFERDHRRMREAGVTFLEQPRRESYGVVAVFRDLYGNKWDLLQPA